MYYAETDGHKSVRARFAALITKETTVRSKLVDTPCWVYNGWKDKFGYGRFSLNAKVQDRSYNKRRHIYAHVLAWKLAGNTIPKDYDLDHLCMVRMCVRPSHLEAVTHDENIRRRDAAAAKGIIDE